MNPISKQADALISLAEEKLTLLNALLDELRNFVEAADIQREEIDATFERQRIFMGRIAKNDRIYADVLTAFGGGNVQAALSQKDAPSPASAEWGRLSDILENHKTMARHILSLGKEAEKKIVLLCAECKSRIRAVQQQKWIYTQFEGQPLKPGSLLNYSEALHKRRTTP